MTGLVKSPKDGSTMFGATVQGVKASERGEEVQSTPQKIDLPRGVGCISRVAIGNYHIVALAGM